MRYSIPSKIRVSLIAFVILVLSAPVPLVYAAALGLNSFVTTVFDEGGEQASLLFNGIVSLFALGAYYTCTTQRLQIVALIFLHMFLAPVLLVSLSDAFGPSDHYWLWFLIAGVVEGALLLLVDVVRPNPTLDVRDTPTHALTLVNVHRLSAVAAFAVYLVTIITICIEPHVDPLSVFASIIGYGLFLMPSLTGLAISFRVPINPIVLLVLILWNALVSAQGIVMVVR